MMQRSRLSVRLAFLLLLGQTGLLLHQLDFHLHANGDDCPVCLVAHALDHPLPALPAAALFVPLVDGTPGRPPIVTAVIGVRHRQARAPPPAYLHV